MKKMPVILAVAMAAMSLASCKKEQELLPTTTETQASPAASTLAKPALLAAGSWHQTGLTVSAPGEGNNPAATSDMFAVARPAMLVRMATFKADGTFSQLRGARPGEAIAEPTNGDWRLNAAADSLIITEANNTRHLAVAELTGSTLRLTFSEGGAAGSKITTYTSVYTH